MAGTQQPTPTAQQQLATVPAPKAAYNFHRAVQRAPLPGEDEIRRAVRSAAERRFMALGGAAGYKQLQLGDAALKEAEGDMRQARLFELLSVTREMRRIELAAQRQRLLAAASASANIHSGGGGAGDLSAGGGGSGGGGGDRFVEGQLLRQRALRALALEAEAARADEQRRLLDDRRALLAREKERLLDRRRRFENSIEGGGANATASGVAVGPPVLVMNVALGNGREERLVVRQGNDPRGVAANFARRHGLPDHTVATLASQIKVNLGSNSGSGGGGGAVAGAAATSATTPRRR